MKIRTVLAEFQADGQTERDDEADSRFPEVRKTRQKSYISANLSNESPTYIVLGSNLESRFHSTNRVCHGRIHLIITFKKYREKIGINHRSREWVKNILNRRQTSLRYCMDQFHESSVCVKMSQVFS